MIDANGNWYPDPPDYPEERRLWKTRYFTQNYGSSPEAFREWLAAEDAAYRQERLRLYGWKLMLMLILFIAALAALVWNPSMRSIVTFMLTSFAALYVGLTPP